MCGIAGFVAKAGAAAVGPAVLDEMVGRLHHRGPDDRGTLSTDRARIGMARLAIIDFSGGHQPIFNEDGSVAVVLNGEIYNYRELRRDLVALGHTFRTESDTECIVHGYEQWGIEVASRLRGMFAFAVWDAPRGRLVVARDRVGEKPLYWTESPTLVGFASELKSLRALPGYDETISPAAIDEYLSFGYVSSPRSIHARTQKLAAGHVLVVDAGRDPRVERYWQPRSTPLDVPVPEIEARIRSTLLEAVREQLVSDVPLGAFLSGGIDSTAVVALMTKVHGGRVKTFCVGFDDERFDERRHARDVAAHLGTEHHEAVVRVRAREDLPRLVAQFDEPFSDKSLVPTYYVARMAREHVTVCLSGDGGDEVFAGYLGYTGALARRERLSRYPHAAREGARWLAGRCPPARGTWRIRKRGLREEERFLTGSLLFDPDAKVALLSPEFLRAVPWAHPLEHRRGALAGGDGLGFLGRLQRLDVMHYLPEDVLTKVDRMTMACSLESRAPLLDHRLVDLGLSLPDERKISGGVTKRVLRAVAEEHVPRRLLDRPKQGFSLPVGSLLRGELRGLYQDVLSDNGKLARSRILRPEAVRAWRASSLSPRDVARAWSLLCLGLWAEAMT